ncbi:AraC family transcriptional regulator [Paenibacillus sp. 32O-W]|uniref:helix-turn-helix domain-containing protein n=1 Tax=Paenibacillus sp. 32O-W TaxID=1695218 RepID=UPI000720F1FD|nr:AraC family transcriptional regulator [Paenibacillus sp. 32O-W]ALS28204.1 AraC family transcriptional regulator [Paenibacillus sp. 32O-W]
MMQGDSSFCSDKAVAVLIDASKDQHAAMLQGLRQYAREHPHWFVFSLADVLLEACKLARIPVPETEAPDGGLQERNARENLVPPSSSVMPDSVKAGYNAALLLDRIIAGQSEHRDDDRPVGPDGRPPAGPTIEEDQIVSEALDFIHNNACEGITVKDLLNEIPLSRRMLEHRFRKAVGVTPHKKIISARLNYVKRLLADTDLTLAEIADRAGFRHAEYLSVAFKREVGIPPGRYRKLYRRKTAVSHI